MLLAGSNLQDVLLPGKDEGVAANDKANLWQALHQTAVNCPLNAQK